MPTIEKAYPIETTKPDRNSVRTGKGPTTEKISEDMIKKIGPVVTYQTGTALEEMRPPVIDRLPPRPKMSGVTVRQHKNHEPQMPLKVLIAAGETPR